MSAPIIIIAPQGMTAEQVHAARESLAFIGRRAAWVDFAIASLSLPNLTAGTAESAAQRADQLLAEMDKRFSL